MQVQGPLFEGLTLLTAFSSWLSLFCIIFNFQPNFTYGGNLGGFGTNYIFSRNAEIPPPPHPKKIQKKKKNCGGKCRAPKISNPQIKKKKTYYYYQVGAYKNLLSYYYTLQWIETQYPSCLGRQCQQKVNTFTMMNFPQKAGLTFVELPHKLWSSCCCIQNKPLLLVYCSNTFTTSFSSAPKCTLVAYLFSQRSEAESSQVKKLWSSYLTFNGFL